MAALGPEHFPNWSDGLPAEVDVAIVGGGFSGLMSLFHVCRALPEARIAVIERRPRALPGPAYGGCDRAHLLNVPAGRMGAFPEDPAGFHRWLDARTPGVFAADDFVPRALFGEYLLETVRSELDRAGKRVAFVHDAVVHLERIAVGSELLLASGRTMVGRSVILCPGLPPARAPWSGDIDHGVSREVLVTDPWEPGAMEVPDAMGEVLVLGSGLTAIDVVQGIRRAGHRGPITLLSRHGRLPLPHAAPGQPAATVGIERFTGGPRGALSALRALARERTAAGLGWQGAVDAIRPHVTALWRSWSAPERARFMRCARALWEVHRHRAPREVLADLAELQRAGTLRIERGSLRALRPAADGCVEAEASTARGPLRLRPVRVFNCIGPGMHVSSTVDPLLGSLLRSGTAVPDALGLGLRAGDAGAVAPGDGGDARLFLVGALRRGDLWETTAVPELRTQARDAAAAAVALLRRDRERGRTA